MYKLRSLDLSLTLGREAAKRGVKCFVELSTGMVYKSDSVPSKESDKLKPWSKIAIFKLQAEEELAKIEGYAFSSLFFFFVGAFLFPLFFLLRPIS